ncbi:MAG TPA: TonB-dependent receptor plug domain-containing protein [Sphingomicrobium sp.]|nr:TonB-dependent receptor plug domain-containing protein [Sphingomicrobium sp.]
MKSSWLVAGAALFVPAAVIAQPAPPGSASSGAPRASAANKIVYTPADFTRFAPKTAYDMLVQIPSFTIRATDQMRGLGQASENVLINGERIANKSGGAVDQLQRTPASNVERIEIVDAASLGIAGLSGQVANVILKETRKVSGQFEYNPSWRAHFAKPELLGGSISYSGKTGPVEYTLSLKNDYGRGAFGGPIWIYDSNHVLTETRREVYHSENEEADIEGQFRLDGPGSSIANLTLDYTPYWRPALRYDHRLSVAGETSGRTITTRLNGYHSDINGDYDFAFGPGRLKLIALSHREHAPEVDTSIMTFGDGSSDTGTRFSRDAHLKETIARSEYRWKSGKNDWQVSFERAFNSLDQKGLLFQLDPGGDFVEVPFPDGSGKVTEVRYESIGTLTRPLASTLDLQVAAGAELSWLDLVGDDEPARKYFRPKGEINLGWHPSKTSDISLKLRRRVGQIDFYDFISQQRLSSERQDTGNPNLVPPQSWEIETEFSHDLGAWGKTRLNLHYYRVEDIIDVIPIGEDGQGIGNLPSANRFGFESTSTLLLDPIGWKGGKLDFTVGAERTRVRDPLTGDKREITGVQDRWMSAQVRHDIPGTPFAWSAYVQYRHYSPYFYLTEIYTNEDLPWIAGFYVEHKNLFGMTARFSVDNVFNGRHFEDRTVWSGFRDRAPIAFIERHNELIGPLFSISIKGTF